MATRNVCVLGGSGFVGRQLCNALSARGCQVTVPTRRRENAKRLWLVPGISTPEANIHDPAELEQLFAGQDAVVNLVGILHESQRGAFLRAHAELPHKVAEACLKAGVPRLLHMSALGAAEDGPSQYQRSKGVGEKTVLGYADRLKVTVFRPSVIFGQDDTFLNLFASLLKVLPVVALAMPDAKFQPVYVSDVARAFADSVDNPATFGQRYDLCGPSVYTLRQLVEYVGKLTGHPRPVIGLNRDLSLLQAAAMELLPVKLMTRDNVLSMTRDNVCECGFPAVLGFQPAALEAIAPLYLSPKGRQTFRSEIVKR